MSFHGYRIPIVVLALVLVLGILTGAQYVYERQTVREPLRQDLAAAPAVDDYHLSLDDDPAGVTVTLAPGADLEQTHTALQRVIDGTLQPPYQLEVQGRPSPAQEALMSRMSVDVYEGIATGEFVAMRSRIMEQLEEHGMDGEVQIARDYVYISITAAEGDGGAYAFGVFPREAIGREDAP